MSNITERYDRFCTRARSGLVRFPFMEKWGVPDWLVGACVYGWFAVVALWFVADCFFGQVINTDECYMNLCCRYYGDQPMAMLTFYLGWLAMQVFGDQVITLRLLMCLSVFVGVGVPCLYCYRRTGSRRWSLFIFACILVAVRSQYYKFYGWDLGPIMFAGTLATLLVMLYDGLSMRKVVAVGAVSALLILARVPTGVIVVPVCFITLWFAAKGRPAGAPAYLRYAGAGLLSFIITALAAMVVMKGSPAAYLASWCPENIITGHGLREALDFYRRFIKDDLSFFWCEYWIAKYAIVSIMALLIFSRKSRLLPGMILLVLLCCRQLMFQHIINVPNLLLDISVILLPFAYNWKSRLFRSTERIRIDYGKLLTILAFVFVMAVGSDRLLMRINFFYLLPLLLVPLYSVRRGMIFWMMLLLTMPGLVFSIGSRLQKFERFHPLAEEMPYHRCIIEEGLAAMYVIPLEPVAEMLEAEGKRFCTFGPGRYAPSYLYEDEKPYRMNTFHFYYKEELAATLDDFTGGHDAVIVMKWPHSIYTPEELQEMLRQRGFYLTGRPGEFIVYERLEPRQFVRVSDYLPYSQNRKESH